jgi:hypothetical protein
MKSTAFSLSWLYRCLLAFIVFQFGSTVVLANPPTVSVFFDDFDPNYENTLWAPFGGIVTANTHGQAAGVGSTGNSLHFAGDGSRFATTQPVDLRDGGSVSFKFALANGSSFPWEDADIAIQEEVVLEYSIDGVNFIQFAGPYNNRNWQNYNVAIPPAAHSAATRLRWRQSSNSGNSFDHWALDDINIDKVVTSPPAINTQPASTTVFIGSSATFSVVATSPIPMTYQWYEGDSGTTSTPVGTNSFSFTTPSLTASTRYWVRVSNLAGSVNSVTATVTVAPPLAAPVFTSAALSPTILTGSPYSATLTASGNPVPTFSVQSGTLPAGLSLNSTSGLLNGTPTSTGTFSGVFAATNSQGTATRAFSFTVNAPLAAPVFTSAALSPAIVTGSPYSTTLTASGNPAPSFSVQSGTLPAGLSLNPTSGVLSGTPTSTGTFSGVFAATNSQGTVTQAFSFTINEPLVAPAFTSAALSPTILTGSPYSATLTASGNPAPSFSVQSGTLPAGLSLNSTSGLLNGTPTSTGTFSGVFAATNSQGTATQAFSYTVNATYTVTFALGSNGTRIGGGGLTQTIAQGGAAVAPLVDANDFWVLPVGTPPLSTSLRI